MWRIEHIYLQDLPFIRFFPEEAILLFTLKGKIKGQHRSNCMKAYGFCYVEDSDYTN